MNDGMGVQLWHLTQRGPLQETREHVDPNEPGEVVKRIGVDLSLADEDLLSRYASYKNTVAQLQEKRLKRKWTIKSYAEYLLAGDLNALRHELAKLEDKVGPLPSAKDEEAMRAYANRVIALDKTPKQEPEDTPEPQ